MTTYGVTPTGFEVPTLEEILADTTAQMQANIDPALDCSSNSPFGQIIAIMAQREVQLWELGTATYSIHPNDVDDIQLDNVCGITGTVREGPTPSIAICTLSFSAATDLPAGSIAAVNGQPDNTWQLLGPQGSTVNNTADVSIASAGTVPNTVWSSVTNGPNVANAGTLTQMVSSVSGWTAITNPTDATLGTLTETDDALRPRRVEELNGEGGSTVDAVRAALLKVTGVLQAFVYENVTDVMDGNGVPPHSIHCIVFDGATPQASNQDIGNAIWSQKGSGVQTYGGLNQTVFDSAGQTHSVSFDRASALDVWMTVNVTVNASKFGGAQQVINALLAYATANQNLADPVVASKYLGVATTVVGVEDVTTVFLGFSSSPSGTTNLAISALQIAVFDGSRIVINVTNDPSPPP